jgi:hypothetical protein
MDELVAATMSAETIPSPSAREPGVPWPVAMWREGDRGVVLSLVQRRDGTTHALVAGAVRHQGTWVSDEVAGVPWVDRHDLDGERLEVAGEMLMQGLIVLIGLAPRRVVRVAVELPGGRRQVPVDPREGAWLVAFPLRGPVTLRLSGLDTTGAPITEREVRAGAMTGPLG